MKGNICTGSYENQYTFLEKHSESWNLSCSTQLQLKGRIFETIMLNIKKRNNVFYLARYSCVVVCFDSERYLADQIFCYFGNETKFLGIQSLVLDKAFSWNYFSQHLL